MEDFEKAYQNLKLENQRLRARLTLLESHASERKRVEQQLMDCRDTLEQKVRQRTEQLEEEIKERKRTEQKTESERRLLRILIDTIPDVIYVKDTESRFTLCNKTCVETLGVPGADAMLGKTDRDFFEPSAAARFRAEEQQIMLTGIAVLKKEESTVAADGKPGWIVHTKVPFIDDRGETIGIIGIAQNITPQKQAQIALAEERNLLRTLINNMSDEIYVKDVEGRFLMCNTATVAGLGVADEKDVMARTDSDFFTCEQADLYRRDEEQVLRTGLAMVDKEESAAARNGSRVWFRTTKAPLADSEGKTIGLIGIGRNVTKEKETQAALTAERNILRIMIDNLPDQFYVKDRQHRFITCNKAVEERHGCLLIGKTDFDLYPRERAEVFHAEEERVMSTGEPLYNKEQYAFYDNGDMRQCSLVNKFPLRDAEGNVTGIVGLNHDITEIKRAQQALQEERNVLRTLIDNLPDHIYVKDAHSRFTACNLAVEQTHAGSPTGKTDFDLYNKSKAEEFYAEEREVIETGKALINKEHYGYDDSGTMTYCWAVSKFPLRDSDGNVVGIVGINHDVTEAKKAQRALAEERNLLRTVIDNLPAHIYVKDLESRFTMCNSAVANMYDRDPLGRNDFDLYPHQQARRYYKEEQEIIRTGRALTGGEWRTLDEFGALVSCWSINKFPLRDASGNISGLVGIDFDITKAKLAEQALRESEERYRALVETLPHGIAEADLRGTLTFANPAILKMLRCTAEQFIGKPAWIFDARPHRTYGGRQYFEWVLANKPEPTPFIGKFRRADGNVVDLQLDWYFKRDIDAAITGVTAVITDITERKLFAEKLRESEEQYRGVVENSLDGIIISRGDTILFVNNRVAEMFGYSNVESLYHLAPWDLIVPEQRQLLRQRGNQRMEGQDVPSHFEFAGVRNDGTRLDVEIRAALISYKGEKAVQVMMRDVTERNRLRRELADYREKILQAEKNAYVNSIGAAVAHQLNQPLTVLNLLLEETLSELAEIPCPQAVKTHLADCLAESKNAGDIVARFRTYSKDPNFEVSTSVNVRQVLARIAAALSDNAARMKVRLTVDQTADVPPVEASVAALEQVSFLLIQNAIQAADGQSEHKLEISVRPARNALRIDFADDCCGIPPENMEKIFEPFFTTKPAGQGTGLGLTIVRRILLAHGGKIAVRSRLGRGSTFTVTWPRKKDA